jgi:hypothetical protein
MEDHPHQVIDARRQLPPAALSSILPMKVSGCQAKPTRENPALHAVRKAAQALHNAAPSDSISAPQLNGEPYGTTGGTSA